MSHATIDRVARWRPSREAVAWGSLLLLAEVMLVLAYVVARGDTASYYQPVKLFVFPWIWINLGIWAVVRTNPAPSSRRNRLVAAGIGAGYFAVLAVVGGLATPVGEVGLDASYRLASIPPGWGPIVFLKLPFLDLTLLPYKVVGYAALAYLVYATALDAANVLVGGIVGLFSCVSCTFPVIASILTGVAGSGTALAGFTYANAYLLSTGVFVLTVGLLYWRPFRRWGGS